MGDRSNIERRKEETRRMADAGQRQAGALLVRCTFCSRAQSEVLTMFAGLEFFICNECVTLFVEEVAKRQASR